MDTRIIRTSKKNPFMNSVALQSELELTDIHPQTIKNRLKDAGLHGRRPARKPLVSTKNKKIRLAFAKEREGWTPANWSKILWSDESKFNLFGCDGKATVRRPVGERYNPRFMIPTVKHGGGNVMVWGCFSSKGVGPIIRIEGTMDRYVYRDILADHMLPYAKRNMPRYWNFQQDNDPKHTSTLVKEWFFDHSVNVLPWPSQSPDLNPIEHLWDEVERRIRPRNYKNATELYNAIEAAWRAIPVSVCQKLVDSMKNRCQAVKKSKGWPTEY
uniref:DDE_3 domain-containing protein n=1 Tax=Rhabditophanes sp. KR3021 TaxID=114890 RepID=A0AC35U2B8_9BILA